MIEVWKEILGYEGLYQISDLGRVKSLPKLIARPKSSGYFSKERILIPQDRKNTCQAYMSSINNVCTGKRREYKGFKFKYV
jgi:hypothetical protein